MPLMVTFSTNARCTYMFTSIVLTFSTNVTIFDFIYIANNIITNYLIIAATAFRAFLICHITYIFSL